MDGAPTESGVKGGEGVAAGSLCQPVLNRGAVRTAPGTAPHRAVLPLSQRPGDSSNATPNDILPGAPHPRMHGCDASLPFTTLLLLLLLLLPRPSRP